MPCTHTALASHDVNADSRWSSTEFAAYTAAYGGSGTFSVVSGADTLISEAEYTSYAKGASSLVTCAWRFSKYDLHSNNQWSQAEFDAYILTYGGSASFSDVDTSHLPKYQSQGGIISNNEWSTYCASSDSFALYDTNGDCKWSCSEVDAYIAATGGTGTCASMDTNGDGLISSRESTAYALSPGDVRKCRVLIPRIAYIQRRVRSRLMDQRGGVHQLRQEC
jgi:hypothetical protein